MSGRYNLFMHTRRCRCACRCKGRVMPLCVCSFTLSACEASPETAHGGSDSCTTMVVAAMVAAQRQG